MLSGRRDVAPLRHAFEARGFDVRGFDLEAMPTRVTQ
jgi:hypothetical protein